MGIAQQEANQLYPDEPFSSYCMIVDDKSDDRDIYVAGRTADPCKEQVEAGAIALFEKQTNFSKGADQNWRWRSLMLRGRRLCNHVVSRRESV